MKKILTTLVLLVLLSVPALAQGWTALGNFPNDTILKKGSGLHGIAVDPYGRVWVQLFGATDTLQVTPDSVLNVRVLYIYNPDGTEAPFSPLKRLVGAGVNDNLFDMSGRGLTTDNDGNIIASFFDRVYRIDYKTGAVLGKVIPTANAALTSSAIDENGNLFTAHVVAGAGPLKMFDNTFSALGNALDVTEGFSRSFQVSRDGNTIFWAGYTNHAIYKYTRADEFSPFVLTDTILKGFDSESFGWNFKYNKLWASSGSLNDRPNRYPDVTTYYDVATWYAYDTQNDEITDSLKWVFQAGADSAAQRPRGIAFTPSGDTAYVGCFSASTFNAVQKFVNPNPSSLREVEGVVTDYSLYQNYPNPFNPSTEIKFNIAQTGLTTLKVYDVLGREVAVLVNRELAAGPYAFTFDAKELASGTYIYELVSGGQRLVNKMLLLK